MYVDLQLYTWNFEWEASNVYRDKEKRDFIKPENIIVLYVQCACTFNSVSSKFVCL